MVKDKERPEEQDEATQALAAAAKLLGKAAEDRENRSAIMKEVETALSKIRLADFPELADSPIVQAFAKGLGVDDLKPGEVRNRGTLAERVRDWSVRDMGQFPTHTFEPRETITVTFNGLRYQLIDGQEITVPEPIWNIYRDHREALRQAEIDDAYLQGYSDQPPHPDWITETTARVRAFSQMGPRPDSRKRGTGILAPETAE